MALEYIFPQGGADLTVYLALKDGSGNAVTGLVAANLSAHYLRPLDASPTAISLSDLGTVDAAHTDGGIIEVDSTTMPGVYRLDLPDAVAARGENYVVVAVTGASIATAYGILKLDPKPSIIQGQVTASPSPTTTVFGVDVDVSADQLNDAFLLFTSGANANIVKQITDTDGAGDEVTTETFPSAPSANDWFIIINQ